MVYSISIPVAGRARGSGMAPDDHRRQLGSAGLVLTALHFPWYVQIGIFSVLGFGFYLLHGCIQVHVTELTQTARGTAASLHSCFFYLGQAAGPVVYGFGFAHGGPEPSIFVGAAVVMGVGLVCAKLLRHSCSALDYLGNLL